MSGKDGGAAFPDTYMHGQHGMTLRDYFAAKAMLGIIIGNNADYVVTCAAGAIGLAKNSYIIADAMLSQRDKVEV